MAQPRIIRMRATSTSSSASSSSTSIEKVHKDKGFRFDTGSKRIVH